MPEPERRRGPGRWRGRAGLGGYPVNLLVAGRRCVVVGAGRIAARKIEALLDAGADVHVVAPGARRRRARLGRRRVGVTVVERTFAPDDLDGAWLATAATPDPAVNRAVFDAGESRRVWVNSADDPEHCSFTLMSVVRQGDLVVTIGTGGRSPALATLPQGSTSVRRWGPSTAPSSTCCPRPARRCGRTGRSSEDADWQRALDSGMLDLIRTGRVAEAKELLETCLSSSSG